MHERLLGIDTVDVEHMVGHIRHRRVRLIDGVHHRITQEPVDEFVDSVVQRRREQHALAAGRCGGQDAGHRGQEAEVGHVVSLVQHGDLDAVEVHHSLFHQVLEPARAGHHDVDTRAQRAHLTALRHAAEDRGDLHAVALRQWLQRSGDLGGELTSRRQD